MARILVIDDDEQTRDVLKQMLEVEGFDVLEAEDGEQGARVYAEKRPDLVITDIIMPRKGGLETIIKLKQDYPDIKIFAVTGGGRVVKADFITIAKSVGALKAFEKPFNRAELIAAVKEAVG